MHFDDLELGPKKILLSCANSTLNRFEKRYPDKIHCLTKENLAERIMNIQHCEMTGIKFNSKKRIYPICINPFEDRIIGINQIALVIRAYRGQYFEICNHISDNIESPKMKAYIESDMRFQLAKNLTIKSLEDMHQPFEIGEHPDISEFIAKNKIKNSREIMLMNINNLSEKSNNGYTKNYVKMDEPVAQFSEQLIRHKIQRCIQKSKMKGLTSDITFENSAHLFHRHHCQLTGMRLQKSGYTKDNQKPETFTLDRINRFEGYNVSNMIVLCYAANQMKSKLEQFNYSEDIDKIIEILETIKTQIYQKYEGKKHFKRKNVRPIEEILENYIKSKNEPKKRCYFE